MKAIFKLTLLFIFSITISCDSEDFNDPDAAELASKSQNATLKTLATGAKLHGTNGIYFGPDDNLYIASFYGQNITVMNKQNGKILRQFGVNEGVLGPDDLVFHPDGKSFYYTDIITNYVGRMSLDGVQMGYQEFFPGTNPITFNSEGRLFVALDFQGDGLYELDPNLVNAPRPIVPYVPGTYPLGFLNAFDFGPDGRLYGPLFLFKMVVSIDVGEAGDPPFPGNFNDWLTDGRVKIVADGFQYPVAAKFGPDGLLTVLDQSGEVFKVNTVTGEKTLFAKLQPGLDNLAFDADGNLFISNADFGWIIQILPSGQARTISGGGMIGPMGLAVLEGTNGKDAVFVGDLFRMRQYNGLTGKEEKVYKGYLVAEPDKLTMPFSVQADGKNLLVTSWFSLMVQVWNPQTDGVLEEYAMDFPIDAVRVNGEIVVSDLVLGGVVRIDKSIIAPLTVASGLATDGETLWAADYGTGEIWQIDFVNPPVVVATGLNKPEGLAFEKPGQLVVVETGTSTLTRIDLASGNKTTVVDGLKLSTPGLGAPPTWWFDGVTVGPSGDIYISGGDKNVIYKVPNNKLR